MTLSAVGHRGVRLAQELLDGDGSTSPSTHHFLTGHPLRPATLQHDSTSPFADEDVAELAT